MIQDPVPHEHPRESHDCADANGGHPCGGHGAADGVCRHEDGTSHTCCRAGTTEVVVAPGTIKAARP